MKPDQFGSTMIRRTMAKHPPLSREAERQTARKAKAGNKKSRDELVLCNLGMVLMHAQKYVRRNGPPLDDLLQYGICGLIRAIDKFDPERGIRLCSYATAWIIVELDRGAGLNEPLVRPSSKDARKSAHYGSSHLSLDVAMSPEGSDWAGAMTFVDALEDTAPLSDEQLSEAEARRAIFLRLRRLKLTPREHDIIRARYMSDGKETLQSIGERHGVSRERIRQIESVIAAKLEKGLRDLAA